MVDFQRGFDPGTEKASRFSSDVLLTDKAQGIEDKPVHISMNEPLTHRGYTFYQSSFIREADPRTGRETGRVQSVLQVGLNPGRRVMYARLPAGRARGVRPVLHAGRASSATAAVASARRPKAKAVKEAARRTAEPRRPER